MAQPTNDDKHADYMAWKGWSDAATFGAHTRGDADYFLREVRRAREVGGSPLRVLEVGFGQGKFLAFGRTQGWEMEGTELAPQLLAAASASGFAVHPAEGTADLAGGYDIIAAFDVLEHIPPEDAVGFLSTLAAKLSPGGKMILRYPNADTWLGNPMQNGDPTHVSAIGYLKMQYLSQAAGLRIDSYRAPIRRGFSTSAIHGLHRMTAGVIIAVTAAWKRGLYFPDLPLVLSSSNVICILSADDRLRSAGEPGSDVQQ